MEVRVESLVPPDLKLVISSLTLITVDGRILRHQREPKTDQFLFYSEIALRELNQG